MGWDGSHLHTFEIGGRYYGDPDAIDDVVNEERLTMNTVANRRAVASTTPMTSVTTGNMRS